MLASRDGDAVGEHDALDDQRQLIFTFQAPPAFRRGHDELEDHEAGGRVRQRALGPDGSVPHRREHALDRVRGSQVFPVLRYQVASASSADCQPDTPIGIQPAWEVQTNAKRLKRSSPPYPDSFARFTLTSPASSESRPSYWSLRPASPSWKR